jgi:phage terminase large subunit
MTTFDQAVANIRRWRADPVSFVRDLFGVEPDPWQVETLEAFANPGIRRISLQAPAGPGKTTAMAWCGWNFLSCYGDRGEHPKGAAVSITEANLATNLWPEFAKWQDRSEFLKHAFTWTKTRIYANDHPETWFFGARVFPQSATPDQQGKTLSGLHGKYIFSLIDESGGIPTTVLRAAEQSLVGTTFGKVMQGGNPISLEGMLAAAATVLRQHWHVVEISGDPDDPRAWVNAPRAQSLHTGNDDCACPRCDAVRQIQTYGRDNPWVMSYVLGQFPPSSLNSLLGPEDVQAAIARELPKEAYNWAQARIGVDVARFGDDRTVLFPRQGKRAFQPHVMRHVRDSAVSTDIATAVLRERQKVNAAVSIMDATGGWAAGARDVLAAGDPNNPPVSVQFHTAGLDTRYKNRRAEMWFQMAEWVKAGGWLPNVPELIAELSTPTYTYVNGKFQIEPKDQVKQRLGRSPDLADALALTFGVPEVVPVAVQPVEPPYRPHSPFG